MDIIDYIIIIMASVIVGIINTLSGSGSLIMLPVLMFAGGLPANIANATNRVAVLVQSLVGTATYLKKGKMSLKGTRLLIIPAIAGAVIGGYIASITDPSIIKKFLGFLMIGMFVLLILKPGQWVDNKKGIQLPYIFNIKNILVMLGIGFYGGFIHAGVGILMLSYLVISVGFDLKMANAIKLVVVLLYAIPVLAIFVMSGQVNWEVGLVSSFGQAIGAYLGATFATKYPKANLWTYRLLLCVLAVSIIKFFYEFFSASPFIDL